MERELRLRLEALDRDDRVELLRILGSMEEVVSIETVATGTRSDELAEF